MWKTHGNFLLRCDSRRSVCESCVIFPLLQLTRRQGGLLAYGIGFMDHVAGLRSWQWIFILEGIATFVVGMSNSQNYLPCLSIANLFLHQAASHTSCYTTIQTPRNSWPETSARRSSVVLSTTVACSLTSSQWSMFSTPSRTGRSGSTVSSPSESSQGSIPSPYSCLPSLLVLDTRTKRLSWWVCRLML